MTRGRSSCSRTPSTTTSRPERRGQRWRCCVRRGLEVVIPGGHLCCGRPLYDFGFLDEAKQYLRNVMERLAPAIDAGVPIVVLEPSCASVFRDELRNLFPDRRARRSPAAADISPERVPRTPAPRVRAAADRRARVAARPLPSQGADEDDRRGVAAAARRGETHRPRRRLLRHGGPVRFRGGDL